jgi:hypothetical protein
MTTDPPPRPPETTRPPLGRIARPEDLGPLWAPQRRPMPWWRRLGQGGALLNAREACDERLRIEQTLDLSLRRAGLVRNQAAGAPARNRQAQRQ